jgi:hypothetical protein
MSGSTAFELLLRTTGLSGRDLEVEHNDGTSTGHRGSGLIAAVPGTCSPVGWSSCEQRGVWIRRERVCTSSSSTVLLVQGIRARSVSRWPLSSASLVLDRGARDGCRSARQDCSYFGAAERTLQGIRPYHLSPPRWGAPGDDPPSVARVEEDKGSLRSLGEDGPHHLA